MEPSNRRRASYAFGIRWIAENDEPADIDPANVAGYISTLLLADLFGKDPTKVGVDIVNERLGVGSANKAAAEATAFEHGRQAALHGGLRGYNPYRPGKVFGARLHTSWNRGYDAGRELLDQNEVMPI